MPPVRPFQGPQASWLEQQQQVHGCDIQSYSQRLVPGSGSLASWCQPSPAQPRASHQQLPSRQEGTPASPTSQSASALKSPRRLVFLSQRHTVGDNWPGGFVPAFQNWCTKSKDHHRSVPSLPVREPAGPRGPDATTELETGDAHHSSALARCPFTYLVSACA